MSRTAGRRRRGHGAEDTETGSRDDRKRRTRRALLDAALDLLEGERSFSSLSLREITRVAGITPAGFYRHFSGMEELGQALIEDSFESLHQMMRDARKDGLPPTHIIRASVAIFLDHVQSHRAHFRFIAKERYSGSSAVRLAIRKEVRLWVGEVAVDLSRFELLKRFSSEDLQMLAGMMINAVIAATELLLDAEPGDAAAVTRIYETVEKQMRLLVLGASLWDSSLTGGNATPRPA
ncbi:MAG: TetR family transcriptional regulator [Nevskiales bacterium]|nr:TetR family transcriptional regulator [Nevskiales bacterium]